MTLGYWIDILDANGAKCGDGPIVTATELTHTALLDRAGTFSFVMPASDPRAALLRVKRQVQCWAYDAGLKLLGAGIINDISLVATADGRQVYTVSGDDLLHELTYRTVGDLALMAETRAHPAAILLVPQANLDGDETSGIDSLSNCHDLAVDDATTYEEILDSVIRASWFVIYDPRAFHSVHFVFDTANTDTDTNELTAEYWTDSAGWEALSVQDGTRLNNRTFGQTGAITFDAPSDWAIASGQSTYKVRCKLSDSSHVKISDISVLHTGPTSDALGPLMALAPTGWSLDTAHGYDSIAALSAVGDELLTNADFETYTGTADDGTTDAFDAWTVSVSAGETVEATATAHGGSAAVKLTSDGSDVGYNALILQNVAVEPSKDYLFAAYTRGDGSTQGAYRIIDMTPGGDGVTWHYANALVNPVDTGITGTDYTLFQHTFTTPPGCNLISYRLYGPWYLYPGAAYFDDVSLKQRLGGQVYLEFANESILEALIAVAEQTGEHFILSPSGRQVLWLRNDIRTSGVRCVGDVDPQAVEDVATVALITDLQEQQSAYDMVSRVYPYGGGTGDDRVTLAHCTRPAPDGYTLDTAAGCLIRDAAEGAYGRIDKRLDCPEIVALNRSATQLQSAANALFDRAYAFLRRHSATNTDPLYGDVPRTYNLTLAKCDRPILPGYTVKVEYSQYNAQRRYIHINGDMWVLSATTQVSDAGVTTVALQCATTDVAPTTDAQLIADMLRKQKASWAHKPGA